MAKVTKVVVCPELLVHHQSVSIQCGTVVSELSHLVTLQSMNMSPVQFGLQILSTDQVLQHILCIILLPTFYTTSWLSSLSLIVIPLQVF